MPWSGYPRAIAPRLTESSRSALSYTHAYAISFVHLDEPGRFPGGKLPSGNEAERLLLRQVPKGRAALEVLQSAASARCPATRTATSRTPASSRASISTEVVARIRSDNTTDNNVTSPQHEAIAGEAARAGGPRVEPRFFAWYHFLDPHDQYNKPHDADGIPPFGQSRSAIATTRRCSTRIASSASLDSIDARPKRAPPSSSRRITARLSASTARRRTASRSGRTSCASRCSSTSRRPAKRIENPRSTIDRFPPSSSLGVAEGARRAQSWKASRSSRR